MRESGKEKELTEENKDNKCLSKDQEPENDCKTYQKQVFIFHPDSNQECLGESKEKMQKLIEYCPNGQEMEVESELEEVNPDVLIPESDVPIPDSTLTEEEEEPTLTEEEEPTLTEEEEEPTLTEEEEEETKESDVPISSLTDENKVSNAFKILSDYLSADIAKKVAEQLMSSSSSSGFNIQNGFQSVNEAAKTASNP